MLMRNKSSKQIAVHTSDITTLLRPYRSGWVALSPDKRRVVAAAPTLEEAQTKAQKQGQPHPLFVKVLPPDKGYLPAQR